MSEIIETVAKAIDEAMAAWFKDPKPERSLKETIGRAAIEAMRELPSDPGPQYDLGEYSRRTQAAMVDDALS